MPLLLLHHQQDVVGEQCAPRHRPQQEGVGKEDELECGEDLPEDLPDFEGAHCHSRKR